MDFDALLKQAELKVSGEKNVRESLKVETLKALNEFVKPIYEFVQHVNETYEQYAYKDGFGSGREFTRMTDVFEFGTYATKATEKKFSIEQANTFHEVNLVSHVLNNRIYIKIDNDFDIMISYGYDDAIDFYEAEALINHVCLEIAKRKLKKVF